MHITKEELLVKRFKSLAKGDIVPIDSEMVNSKFISEELAHSKLDCDLPHNWDTMSLVEQALFTIDNSQAVRSWIKTMYIVKVKGSDPLHHQP